MTARTKNTLDDTAAVELVEADEAMRLLHTSRSTLYRWVRRGHIRAMKAGRQWRFCREDIDRFLRGESPRVFLDRAASLEPFIETLLAAHKKTGGESLLPPPALHAEDPVAYAADLVVYLAIRVGASDIHLSPQRTLENKIRVPLRLRVDGALRTCAEADPSLLRHLVARWKTLAGCDVHEATRPQEGLIRVSIPPARTEDLRLTVLPSSLGEGVVIRLWQLDEILFKMTDCFSSPEESESVLRAVRAPNGLVLFTGPTGCGKMSAMLAAVREIMDPASKIVSIEDAPMTHLPGVDQLAVNEEGGISLYAALKGIGHADPDVIVCAEFPKDLRTLQICCELAQTGHLLMMTMTADDACQALLRLQDMGGSPYMIADAVRAVVCLRLVRLVCRHCAKPAKPSKAVLKRFEKVLSEGGVDAGKAARKFRDAPGCPECGGRGFRGRRAFAEILEMSRPLARALLKGVEHADLLRLAVSGGMAPLQAALVRMVCRGETSIREAERVFAQNGW